MVSPDQADDLRLAQAELRRLVEAKMNEIIEYLAGRPDLTPEQFRNSLIAQTNLVVSQFGEVAASMAAEWYEDVRLADGIRDAYRAVPFPSSYGAAEVEGTVRRGVATMFTEEPDVSEVMRAVSSTAGKYVVDAARETVRRNTFRDPRADGWRRVARGETCDFCLMLVGRGGVYRRETVLFASHKKCDCAAVPSFDPGAPEVDVKAYEASARTSRMSEEQRLRHRARVRDWLSANKGGLDAYRDELLRS